jgi:hypothetical protein
LTHSRNRLKTVSEKERNGALVQVIGLGHTVDAIIREACSSLGIEPWGGPSEDGWSKHADFLRCPYRFYLKHVAGMGPLVVGEGPGGDALDVGSCVHLLLACHYARMLPDERYPGFRPNCPDPETLLKAMIDAHLPLATASEVERLYGGYAEHYASETIEPMAVEMGVGVVGAHTARYDLVFYIEDGLHDGLWVGEHKTASPSTDLEEFRYDGEVLGEMFAARLQSPIDIFGMPLNGVCINALVKAKGLPRYQRLWITFPQSLINEFGTNRGYWGQQMLACEKRNLWPKNLYGCRSRYRRCRFWEHCRTQDPTRLVKLEK